MLPKQMGFKYCDEFDVVQLVHVTCLLGYLVAFFVSLLANLFVCLFLFACLLACCLFCLFIFFLKRKGNGLLKM